jgi:hypothetical protein
MYNLFTNIVSYEQFSMLNEKEIFSIFENIIQMKLNYLRKNKQFWKKEVFIVFHTFTSENFH